MAEPYDTISDVRVGAAVELPVVTDSESFVLLRIVNDEVNVTMFNLTREEALDALMGTVMGLRG